MSDPSATLRLSPEVRDTIERHARETYPFECCGALIGQALIGQVEAAEVVKALPLENVTEEGPRRRFLVRPNDYVAVERDARAAGLVLLGFYHSHPDHPPRPSAHDLAHAWPTLHYVIASVVQRDVAEVRAWRLQEDRSAFVEVRILVNGGAGL